MDLKGKIVKKKVLKKKDTSVTILREVAKDISDYVLVRDMPEIKYVPTLFTSYNRATGLGGHPFGRIALIHGPYQVGKSVLGLTIVESIRRKGHAAMVFDSEVAGEKEWYSAITPKSGYKVIENLDVLRDDINSMMKRLERKKEKKLIPADTGCVFLVDTITKLLPKNILDKIEKEGIDKMYPIQSLWISIWMKEIVPMLNRHNSALIVVLQERTKIGAGPFEKQYNITGGNAIQYDNGLRIRVTHSEKLKQGEKKVVGMQCYYKVENNKLDGTSFQEGIYFTSNGKGGIPKGLDLVREMVEECKSRGYAVKKKDSVEFDFDNKIKFINIEGGWADCVDYFRKEKDDFKMVVSFLNKSVLRINHD